MNAARVSLAVIAGLIATGCLEGVRPHATDDLMTQPRMLVGSFLRHDSLGRVVADSIETRLRAQHPEWLVLPQADAIQYVRDQVYSDGTLRPGDLRELAKILRVTVHYDVSVQRDATGMRASVVALVPAAGRDTISVATVRGSDMGSLADALAPRISSDLRRRQPDLR